ncbi:MAG: MG2 domain-containing protein [Candidatus Competibacteraceae bacterium]
MAYGQQGDFNFLDLTGPAFDLTDRGVEGRELPGPVDVFLYTERGVYRPGETVQLMALMRDSRGYALPNLPLTLKIVRPDQVEVDRPT